MENTHENAKAVIVRLHAVVHLKQSRVTHHPGSKPPQKEDSMKARLVVILCAILLGLFAFGQMGIVMAAGSEKQVPFGSPIEDSDLDGVLGEEWADAESFITRIGSYRADVYMKHDRKYWYIAVTKQGRIRGGTVTLWMCFDANGDGQLYSRGDDSLILPDTDGTLARDVDWAYTRTMKAPKKDTSVGGTNDKIGAGKFSDNRYVFETKIEMDSGDHGSSGNDMVLALGDKIAFVIGLMNGGDKAGPKTVAIVAALACTCSITPSKPSYCLGEPVNVTLNIAGNCQWINCSVWNLPTAAPAPGQETWVDGLPLIPGPGNPPGGGGGSPTPVVGWNQTDNAGNPVGLGTYEIWCTCFTQQYFDTSFQIVQCPEKEEVEEEEEAPIHCLEPPVFEDDFSNPESGWPVYRATADYNLGFNFEAQEYFISVKTPDTQAWSINQSAGTFQDFCLEVDATQVGGPDNNTYGVIFGYQDDDNFHTFTISGDGYYSLTKRINGIDTAIVAPTASPSINQGQSSNHLEVIVRGADVYLYVNTQLLTTVSVPTLEEGYLGLYAASISGGDVRIRFDNLAVRQAQ